MHLSPRPVYRSLRSPAIQQRLVRNGLGNGDEVHVGDDVECLGHEEIRLLEHPRHAVLKNPSFIRMYPRLLNAYKRGLKSGFLRQERRLLDDDKRHDAVELQ